MSTDVMWAAVYLVACGVAVVCALAANLLSPRPCGTWCHLRRIGRVLVLAAAAVGAARVLETGVPPQPEVVVLMLGIAVLATVQVHREIQRQTGVQR